MTPTDRDAAGEFDTIVATMVERIVDRFAPERTLCPARGPGPTRRSGATSICSSSCRTGRTAVRLRSRSAWRSATCPPRRTSLSRRPARIAQRGHVIGTVLRAALSEGKVLYERARGRGGGAPPGPPPSVRRARGARFVSGPRRMWTRDFDIDQLKPDREYWDGVAELAAGTEHILVVVTVSNPPFRSPHARIAARGHQ